MISWHIAFSTPQLKYMHKVSGVSDCITMERYSTLAGSMRSRFARSPIFFRESSLVLKLSNTYSFCNVAMRQSVQK